MMKRKKTLVITDLDNTLFDWVSLWLHCFSSLLEGIVATSGISKETLIPEIRMIHQKHGTSEYSFLIDELPSLQPFLNGRPATEVFAEPIASYRQQRRKHLYLYPTVGETLLKIKGAGTCIVGYTESMAFYSNYRLRHLGLDGVFDYIFCPEDHVLPAGLLTEDIRSYPPSHYDLKYTKQHYIPKGSTKPDPDVLRSIISNLVVEQTSCVYVGDNLLKDVAMAHSAGIDDVWAKYGQAHERKEYKLLQEVTHWTDNDVEREQQFEAGVNVNPTYTLEAKFSEILDMFEFQNFHSLKR